MKRLQKEKEEAIRMRLGGMSYSQIKSKIKVSKSSLSAWLAKYPLSDERIRELRDVNPRRIENYRKTMALKWQAKLNVALEKAKKDIKHLSKRELFILGFALYWAEGGKTRKSTLHFGNTDPDMLKVFVKWLILLGVPKERLRVKLHMYKDMDKEKTISFWEKTLGIKSDQFGKPYVKNSYLTGLTYKHGFGHGTCNIVYHNTELASYVLMGIRHIINDLIDSKMRA
ncbi:MAG: hypothetical protein AAB350_01860 [Patescibacteria group bacterium]